VTMNANMKIAVIIQQWWGIKYAIKQIQFETETVLVIRVSYIVAQKIFGHVQDLHKTDYLLQFKKSENIANQKWIHFCTMLYIAIRAKKIPSLLLCQLVP